MHHHLFWVLCILLLSTEAFATKHTVTINGNSGAGSLRAQVLAAASGDTIIFDAATNGIFFTFQGDELLTKNLTIIGNGVGNTILAGGNADRMFVVETGYNLYLETLTCFGFGNTSLSGGVFLNRGTLTLDGCVFQQNTALQGGVINNDQGAIVATRCRFNLNSAAEAGGAIFSSTGSVIVSNSTFSNNTISTTEGYQHGGAIMNFFGPLSINNCTFSGNQAGPDAGWGGAIYHETSLFPLIIITNSTLSGNTATVGGAIYSAFSGIQINNTIVAGNNAAASPDAHNDTGFFSGPNSYNLIGDNTGLGMPAGNGNILGTGGNPVDPQLEPLPTNGTTRALQCTSPAIDAGDPLSTTPDQRGVVVYNIKDIGAYEVSGECDVTISGIIATENAIPIAGVKVLLTGDRQDSVITTGDGLYSFSVSTGGNYTVTPTKSDDVTFSNGITTLDISLIRRHVLGHALLNSPYKIIAADGNGNTNVNTTDISSLRLVILNNNVKFPGNRLWEFVSSYNTPTDPFPITTSRTYSNITVNQTDQDFTGVKLGDVNNSWNPATP